MSSSALSTQPSPNYSSVVFPIYIENTHHLIYLVSFDKFLDLNVELFAEIRFIEASLQGLKEIQRLEEGKRMVSLKAWDEFLLEIDQVFFKAFESKP